MTFTYGHNFHRVAASKGKHNVCKKPRIFNFINLTINFIYRHTINFILSIKICQYLILIFIDLDSKMGPLIFSPHPKKSAQENPFVGPDKLLINFPSLTHLTP